MAVVGLGTDLAQVSRFRRLLVPEKKAVIERLFTPGEIEYCRSRKDPAAHFAARFAAKEAFLKALGLGLRLGLSWQDMDVVRDRWGRPSLELAGRAAALLRERKITGVSLSYSHDGDYAVASVILEGA